MDGSHTLLAAATDRATNLKTVSRMVIVDNTRPDALNSDGPVGEMDKRNRHLHGTDNLTPVASLMFAWRLDNGPWSVAAWGRQAITTAPARGTRWGYHAVLGPEGRSSRRYGPGGTGSGLNGTSGAERGSRCQSTRS
jgi:hypothetical protein